MARKKVGRWSFLLEIVFSISSCNNLNLNQSLVRSNFLCRIFGSTFFHRKLVCFSSLIRGLVRLWLFDRKHHLMNDRMLFCIFDCSCLPPSRERMLLRCPLSSRLSKVHSMCIFCNIGICLLRGKSGKKFLCLERI